MLEYMQVKIKMLLCVVQFSLVVTSVTEFLKKEVLLKLFERERVTDSLCRAVTFIRVIAKSSHSGQPKKDKLHEFFLKLHEF